MSLLPAVNQKQRFRNFQTQILSNTVIFLLLLTMCVTIADCYLQPRTIPYFEDFYFLSISGLFFVFIIWHSFYTEKEATVIKISIIDILIISTACYLTYRTKIYVDVLHAKINTGLTEVYMLFALYYVAKTFVKRSSLKQFIILLIVAITVFEATLSILQYYKVLQFANVNYATGGTFINPAVLGNFFSLTIPFIFSFILKPDYFFSERRRIMLVATILIAIYAVILSMSRSSWIGIFAGISTILILKFHSALVAFKQRHFWLLLMISLLILLIFCGGLFMAYQLKQSSSNGRYFIYKRSLELSTHKPFAGYGLNSFGRDYNLYQSAYFKVHDHNTEEALLADDINVAPSDWIQFLIELGWIGVLLIISIISLFIYSSIKNIQQTPQRQLPYQIGGIGTMISLVTCSILSYPLHILSIAVILTPVVALVNIERRPICRFNIPYSFRITRNILISTVLAGLLYIQIIQYSVQKKWMQIRLISSFLNNEETIAGYTNLTPYLNDRYLFLSEAGSKQLYNGNYQTAISIFTESNKYFTNYMTYMYLGMAYQYLKDNQAAEKSYEIAINIAPNRFLPKYYLLKFYVENDQLIKAKKMRTQILEMPVKIPGTLIDNIKAEVKKLPLTNIKAAK